MIVVEVVAGLLVAAVGAVALVAAVVGALGMLGAVRFVRCSRCHRFGVTSAAKPLRTCVHCRHGWVLHPVLQWHHARPPLERTRHRA